MSILPQPQDDRPFLADVMESYWFLVGVWFSLKRRLKEILHYHMR